MKTVVASRKPPPPRQRSWSLALLVGLAVAGGVALLRQTGMLQSAELYAYDALIRVQPDWGSDPRLVFVAVDDRTVARLNSDTLSDAALLTTLERLQAYAPRVIAVDVFRDVPIGPGRDALLDYLNQQFLPLEGRIKPIILTCQLPSLGNPRGVDPPPVLDPADGIGYADVELDADKVVRRVAFSSVPATETPFFGFALTPGPEVRCRAPFALGFLSALSYLQAEGITLSRSAGGNFNVGGVRFAPLPRTMGGYNNLDPGLYQTLLAYRGRRPAVVVSLADVLEGTADSELFRDRVVLLGYSTLDKGDFHETPYGRQQGTWLHARLVSQVLAAVLDGRPLIWAWPRWLETLWIAGWSIAGAWIALSRIPTTRRLVGLTTLGGGLIGGCWLALLGSGWLPLVPAGLALFVSGLVVRHLRVDRLPTHPPMPYTEEGVTQISPAAEAQPGRVVPSLTAPLPRNAPPIATVEPHDSPFDEDATVPLDAPQPSLMETEPLLDPEIPAALHDTAVEGEDTGLPVTSLMGGIPQPNLNWNDSFEGSYVDEAGRYRIEHLLGEGGMGKVFLARDERLAGRQVAVKIMTACYATGYQVLLQRFEREVAVLAPLKSIHVVQISDFGLTPPDSIYEGAPFYVMEYLEGETLGQRLRAKSFLGLDETLPTVIQICAGLREAHQRGVIHRDLKPDNIFLVPEKSLGALVKILDFGIAKVVGEESREPNRPTTIGSFIGTYRYASPEQCLGRPDIDHRTDIYSLGMIIYRMLSGTNPFGIGQIVQDNGYKYWIDCHVHVEPIPLSSHPTCQDLPAGLEAVVMRCLCKDPQDRFADIDALEQALAALPGFNSGHWHWRLS